MKTRGIILLLLCICSGMVPLRAQRDFLTSQEVDAIRDAQEHGKRAILYMEFAGRRLDAMKAAIASQKGGAGRSVQANLKEYISILEALETTFADGWEQRSPLEKALKQLQERGSEFLKYLQSLEPETSPGFADYRFTLEEAIVMTQEALAEAEKGPYPEMKQKESAPSQQ
ncbi:MAG: hypothetical protein A3H27_15640 [Acidobacteria bacterium RIFCSPLOWO2_02_FULL_59_13]|nr:MAG: hypothetical protein A3H27_15640 [Acidobacteria bacterium RIFCSPLOWO2_02_FULL_59_13]